MRNRLIPFGVEVSLVAVPCIIFRLCCLPAPKDFFNNLDFWYFEFKRR
jgi:hypothetical protein